MQRSANYPCPSPSGPAENPPTPEAPMRQRYKMALPKGKGKKG